VIGLFSEGKQLAGDVDWAHPREHLWRVRDEEGHTGYGCPRRGYTCYGCLWRTLWVHKERLYLLWVPLVDHCGGLHEKMLASALMDICGNYDFWDFVNMHSSYPLCGWTWSELIMRITRPVRSWVLCGGGPVRE